MAEMLDNAERRRIAELRRYDIIGTGSDERFDRLTRLATSVLDVPIALVSLFDDRRHWIMSRVGIELQQAPRELSFLPDPDAGTDILEITDPANDQRLSQSPLVNGDSQVRFFAAAPIRSPAGHTLGMLCVMDRKSRRLTERQRAKLTDLACTISDVLELHRLRQEALHRRPSAKAAERKLGPILNLIPSLVIVLDPNGSVVEANALAIELAGASHNELDTKPIWEWPLWSYVAEAQKKIREAVATAAAGATSRYDALIRTPAGSLITVDILMTPTLSENGEVELIVASGIDISSRLAVEEHLRESEKRFRGTFENAAVGMAHASLDGRWLRFNEVLLETLGYSQEEFLQTTLPELAHPEDLTGHMLQFGRLKSGEIDRYSKEERYIRKDGQFVWVNVTVSLQRSEFGEPLYAILVIEDIAFRKEAERRQRLLVGELSHRVKNIMSMVQSIANQSLRSSSESEVYVNAFRARLQAMARAHDLLTQESWQRADLGALVQSQATLNGAIESERVNVAGPALMLGGQVALNLALVIHELASNALRHGSLSVPEGKVDVSWVIDETVNPRIVDLTWRESNGPLVHPPTELGFGAKLVERSLKRGLGANVNVGWEPGGVTVRMQLPVPEVAQEDYFAP
jgi:PAS domain S-box-containing protein